MAQAGVPTLTLPSGRAVPRLGLGTWRMGESSRQREIETEALKLGIDLGMTLIDTAEMYADGGAERVVGGAIKGRRDDVFIVSKVLPENASRSGTITSCERSLKRLGIDSLDLYLLHWPGRHPMKETLAGFEALLKRGLIRAWGVSNFDVGEMQDLLLLPGGSAVETNQVVYNLARRGIESELLPWCRERSLPIMAYSPVDQGRILRDRTLAAIAARHGASPAQVALAWLLRQEDLMVIPKASSLDHVRENRAALDLRLAGEDLAELDRAFPAPRGRRPLEML